MSKYLEAGEFFRQREQVARREAKLYQQFHNGDTATKDSIAPALSECGQQSLTIGRAIHALGLTVKVESYRGHSTFRLLDGREEISSFEV